MKQYLILFSIFFLIIQAGFSQSFDHKQMDSLLSVLDSKNKGMGSVAISKNGKLVYSNAMGYASVKENNRATTATRYRIGSITKMFTGVLIFQLLEEKKLRLDDKLSNYFPAVPNATKISIANLLNHHSGIHNFTDDSLYMTYHQRPKTQQEMLDIITAATPDFEPGTKADYSNSNFVLLGYIAEKITKKPYSQLIKERITAKIQLPDTYVGGKTNILANESYSYNFINNWQQETETDMSIPGAAGAIVSTPSDLVNFIDALFAGKLVSRSSLEKMKQIKDGYGLAMIRFPFYDKIAYGHNGGIDGFVSTLGYFPDDSVAVAYCSNGQVYPVNDVLIGVLSIYFNKPYTIPVFTSFELAGGDLDKYLGVYSSTEIPLKITITKNNVTLMAQATGQQAFPLEPTAKDIFKFDRAGVVMEFNPAKNEFTLIQGQRFLFTKDN